MRENVQSMRGGWSTQGSTYDTRGGSARVEREAGSKILKLYLEKLEWFMCRKDDNETITYYGLHT